MQVVVRLKVDPGRFEDRCAHIEWVDGRRVRCVAAPYEQVDGFWWCQEHEPPGPKVA